MSGLGIEPSSASRASDPSARVSPAMSRTVVTPPTSAVCSRRSARGRASSPDGSVARWTCVSMRPGITNRPVSETVVAPAGSGRDPVAKMAVMRSPSIRIVRCASGALPASSMTVASTRAVTDFAGACAATGAGRGTNPSASALKSTILNRRMNPHSARRAPMQDTRMKDPLEATRVYAFREPMREERCLVKRPSRADQPVPISCSGLLSMVRQTTRQPPSVCVNTSRSCPSPRQRLPPISYSIS